LRYALARSVTYRGRDAIRLIESDDVPEGLHSLAIVPTAAFIDGSIETEIAGSPRSDAPPDARGFVGIAFRVQSDARAFEAFYLRPTNGRSDDQLRRNHSTQYISHPDYPWYRLREESPGRYESYADLAPGEWTPIRIVVSGSQALLYVNKAEQPCLVVNDLKLDRAPGQIALWIGGGTEGFFSTKLTLRVGDV
jgi:hypothetical protein